MVQNSRARGAAVGVGATVLALGAGHVVAAFVGPKSSPVIAVGTAAIDLAPRWLKEWAISTFGTADKPVLIAGVCVVVLALAALAGILQSRRGTGTWVLAGLAAIAGLAAVTRSATSPAYVLPSMVAGTVAIVAVRLADVRRHRDLPTGPTRNAGTISSATELTSDRAPVGEPGRRVLLGSGAMAGAGLGLAYLGVRLDASPAAPSATTALPAPVQPLGPLPAGLENTTMGLSPLRTPVADFYRIDTALFVPRVKAADWRLRIDGDVERAYELTYEELLAMPMVEADITLNCVSNPVGGEYIGATRWLGVPTRDILARAGIRPTADQILSTSVDGMTISTPVAALQDDRGALIAVAMDGEPLTAEHGYPVRMVTPGLYGYVGATKWLTRLTATTYAAQRAYWSDRGWDERAEVKTQSRIDVPASGESFAAGFPVVIAGVAWSQAREGISRVEVRVDDGEWQDAELGPDVGEHYWRQWRFTWPATSGAHRITVRASDGDGSVQTTDVAEPAPNGASGLHSISLSIA